MPAGFLPIIGDLGEIARCFDLREKELGEVLLDIACDGIFECFASGVDPDGNAWPPLSEEYAKQKARDFPGLPIGARLELMSSDAEVRGTREVTSDRATMEYGTTDLARSEAEWFQDPAGGRQPPRVFYGLTALAIQAIDSLLDRRFDEYVGK